MKKTDCRIFDEFIGVIAAGIEAARDDAEAARAVEGALPKLLADGSWLAPAHRTPNDESYARNLIYRHPSLEFVVVAMVWRPGQATPVHDHDGLWCVEGVLEGAVRITQYDPIGDIHSGDRVRLREAGVFESVVGDTGRLIPPFEFHKIENPGDRTAITLHVYKRDLVRYRLFEDAGDGTYAVKVKNVRYSPATLRT